MSRVGRLPIPIPQGVDVIVEDNRVTVRGPRGTLSRELHKDMSISVSNGEVIVQRPSDEKFHKSLHGLTRSLVANMVKGVTEGYERTLEISGVGYKAAKQGRKLVLSLGYSHPVEIEPEEGIELDVPIPTRVTVKGIDKERVGEVAANIRAIRKPEPYKGKGVMYAGEKLRRKAGKTGKAAKK